MALPELFAIVLSLISPGNSSKLHLTAISAEMSMILLGITLGLYPGIPGRMFLGISSEIALGILSAINRGI